MNRKSKGFLITIIIVCATLGVISILYLPGPLKEGKSGVYLSDTTWEGNILVSGDVIIPPGVTLTIKPGTWITVTAHSSDTDFGRADKNPDDLNTGDPTVDYYNGGREFVKKHVSIHIFGKIICKGTKEQPIMITSDSPNPSYTDWIGLSVMDGEFEYTTIQYCIDPIYSIEGFNSLTISHCNINHVFSAGIGFIAPKDPNNSKASVTYTTISDCGHEAIDTHSCGDIEIAYNFIEKSQVGLNLRKDYGDGPMTANVHNNIIVDTTMPLLIAGPLKLNVSQNVFSAKIQDNTRWSYADFVMPQFNNPVCVFAEPGAQFTLELKHNILYNSPSGIQLDDFAGAFLCDYNNFDQIATPIPPTATFELGIHTYYMDSEFVEPINNNYRLKNSSGLIGLGDPSLSNPNLGAYPTQSSDFEIGWYGNYSNQS